METAYQQFSDFAPHIAALPPGREFTPRDLLTPTFRLAADGNLAIYYAPFDYVNTNAKIILLGITPGFTQLEIGYREARDGLHAGLPHPEILQRVKRQASFGGTMRNNLVSMLDGIGIAHALGLPTTASLFGKQQHLLHSTSVIKDSVFVSDKNYTGHTPRLIKTSLFRSYFSTLFEELESIPDALIIPLGDAVNDFLLPYVKEEARYPNQYLLDFPHPSGGNGHRVKHFLQRQPTLRRHVAEWFSAQAA